MSSFTVLPSFTAAPAPGSVDTTRPRWSAVEATDSIVPSSFLSLSALRAASCCWPTRFGTLTFAGPDGLLKMR
jgi:hypothetical protein